MDYRAEVIHNLRELGVFQNIVFSDVEQLYIITQHAFGRLNFLRFTSGSYSLR